ncbi:MAG: hypothetical protein PHW66_00585 [Gallionella sp.]|jgi:hypothetical protein|nr:hypothetical protein [Gallionella sp.]
MTPEIDPADLPLLTDIVDDGLPTLTEIVSVPETGMTSAPASLSDIELQQLAERLEPLIAAKLEAKFGQLQQSVIAETLAGIREELPQWLRETRENQSD